MTKWMLFIIAAVVFGYATRQAPPGPVAAPEAPIGYWVANYPENAPEAAQAPAQWQTGRASFYGEDFRGRLTASGSRFYAWLMACALKASGHERPQKVLVGIEYLPTGGVWEWSLDPWELALVGAELEVTIKSILECRFWDARIGHCEYCGVTCPLAGSIPPVALKTEADAQALARFVTACGAQLSQVRKALRAWVKKHGPLVTDRARFEYRDSVTPVYDIARLQPALDEAGINLDEFSAGETVSRKFWEGKADETD